jgi:hypothetical protein
MSLYLKNSVPCGQYLSYHWSDFHSLFFMLTYTLMRKVSIAPFTNASDDDLKRNVYEGVGINCC